MQRFLLLLAAGSFAAGAFAADAPQALPQQNWFFQGVFGKYDKASLQRGFQVYKEVCAACHSLNMVAFHDLAAPGGPGFTEAQARVIAASYNLPAEPNQRGEILDAQGNRLMRKGALGDHFPAPFANEQTARTANGGALPPDLSLIVKARKGGPDYVYAILTGFGHPLPQGVTVPEGRFYNPYFPGHAIAMPPPLHPDGVSFADGTPPTVENQARDAVTFLAWASEPQLEARHKTGFTAIIFLALFAGLLFLTYRRIWHGKPQDESLEKDYPGTGTGAE